MATAALPLRILICSGLLLGCTQNPTVGGDAGADAAMMAPDLAVASADLAVAPADLTPPADLVPPVMDDAGGFIIQDCSKPPAWQAPPSGAGYFNIAGRAFNLEDTTPLGSGTTDDMNYKTIQINFYDPIAYATNPASTTPLNPTPIQPDACGYYFASNLMAPPSGFCAVATQDVGSNTLYYPTGVSGGVANGQLKFKTAWFTKRTTVQQWTTSAGNPFGAQTFADKGVYFPIFVDTTMMTKLPHFPVGPFSTPNSGGWPSSGVKVTMNNLMFASNAYYFSGTDPLIRRTVLPSQTSTGVNGSAMFVNAVGIQNFSGKGSEPSDSSGACVWPTYQGASIGGVIFVAQHPAVESSSSSVYCGGNIPQ